MRDVIAELRRMLTTPGDEVFVACDEAGTILEIDREVEPLAGRASAELVGRNVFDLLPPEVKAEVEAAFSSVLRTGASVRRRVAFRRSDGTLRWVEATSTRYRDRDGNVRLGALVRDVTELVHGALVPSSEADRLRHLAERVFDLVAEIDPDGMCRFIGDQCRGILGTEPHELVGTDLFAVVHPDSVRPARRALRELLEGTPRTLLTVRVQHRDGSDRWIEVAATCVHDGPASPCAILLGCRDVTEAARSPADSRDRRDRDETLAGATSQVVYDWDARTNEVRFHGDVESLFGNALPPEALAEAPLLSSLHGEDRQDYVERIRSALEARRSFRVECRVSRDGSWRTFSNSGFPLVDDDGGIRRVLGFLEDVSERRAAEQALREQHELFERISRATTALLYVYDVDDHCVVFVNDALSTVLGRPPDELRRGGLLWLHALAHPDDRRELQEHRARAANLTPGAVVEARCRILHADGHWRWLRFRDIAFARGEAGEVRQVLGTASDETESVRAEEMILASEERYRIASELASDYSFAVRIIPGEGLRREWLTGAFERITGYEPDELPAQDWARLTHPDDVRMRRRGFRRAFSDGLTEGEFRIVTKSGEARWIHERARVRALDDGSTWWHGVHRDITERKLAEQSLRESETRYRTLVENAYDLICELTVGGRFLYASPNYATILGLDPDDLCGRRAAEIVHPDDRERVIASLDGLEEGGTAAIEPFRVRHGSGAYRWMESQIVRHRDAAGRATDIVTTRDITDAREAEMELARSQERILQGQKLEALGRLSGGVAHDFNNLLAVVTVYCELLLDELAEDHALRAETAEVLEAVQRASGLTRQLQAFSRSEVIRPEPIDLNQFVSRVRRLLQRLIGEDVELVTELDAVQPVVEADASGVEQLVMNLTANARDAMPRGGVLRIETSDLQLPGDADDRLAGLPAGTWVRLDFADNGVGMSEETRARAFEPFFTTKAMGRGTGLGLASAYGIVRQWGGHISIDSRPGCGSRVSVYLPAATRAPAASPRELSDRALQGCETVLLVEDEDAVRRLLGRNLRRHGYTVLEAAAGDAALRLSETHPGEIAALVTDVVLPGMGGRELAETLYERRPGLAILFMSGFSDGALQQRGAIGSEVALIQKPFSMTTLLRKLRAVLEKSSD